MTGSWLANDVFSSCIFTSRLLFRKWGIGKTKSFLSRPRSVSLVLFPLLFFIAVYTISKNLEIWPWYPPVDNWCEREKIPEYMLHSSSDDITITTLFLDLGIFKKGEQMLAYHSPYKYKRWMRVFGRLLNPVVAFIEKDDDVEYFRKIRSCLPSSLTKIIQIQRDDLSSFRHLSEIREIYSQPSYPKIHPNTVYPEYSCAMNAKYDVLENACAMDIYKTQYFAWLDIGLFRGLDGTNYDLFKLIPPNDFDISKVGFSLAWPTSLSKSVQNIIMNKLVWVSGSMILATKEKMLNFTQGYKDTVIELLRRGLSNTDQEVIHSMYSHEMQKANQVGIQAFSCQGGQYGLWGPDARYFCLGYMCKHAWDNRISYLKKDIV